MLPAEAFAEVVAFFALYDLDALKLTNRLCYQLAQQCANRIRVFDFSHLTFDIKTSNGNFKIYVVGRLIDEDVGRPHRLASSIRFADENEMSTFVAQAFRNCTLRQLTLNNRHFDRNAIVAMKEIANTMIISKTLSILIESNDTLSEIFEFVDAFRHVERLAVWPDLRRLQQSFDSDTEEITRFCLDKGIRASYGDNWKNGWTE